MRISACPSLVNAMPKPSSGARNDVLVCSSSVTGSRSSMTVSVCGASIWRSASTLEPFGDNLTCCSPGTDLNVGADQEPALYA